MGADIEEREASIIINGGKKLSGADIQASDLRDGSGFGRGGSDCGRNYQCS